MANKNTQLNQSLDVDDEIDLIDLIKTLWESRKTIIKITAVVTFFSLIYAFLAPVQYRSSASFYIATNDSGSSSALAGYAAMLGVSTESNIDGMMASVLSSDLIKEKVAINYKAYFKEDLRDALDANEGKFEDKDAVTLDFLIKELKLEKNFGFSVDKNNLYKINYTYYDKALTVRILNDYLKNIFEFNETLELSNNKNIIKVIDKPKVPLKKFKPKRKLVLIVGFVFGFFMSILYVFIMPFISQLRSEIESS